VAFPKARLGDTFYVIWQLIYFQGPALTVGNGFMRVAFIEFQGAILELLEYANPAELAGFYKRRNKLQRTRKTDHRTEANEDNEGKVRHSAASVVEVLLFVSFVIFCLKRLSLRLWVKLFPVT
jgi:hypothetical protein